jgi:hypothetical protein
VPFQRYPTFNASSSFSSSSPTLKMASELNPTSLESLNIPMQFANTIRAQSQRTRPNTTRPKRRTGMGMPTLIPCLLSILAKPQRKFLCAPLRHSPARKNFPSYPRLNLLIKIGDLQDQEAQDPPISLSQRHRPQVPKKPQTRSARYDEGAEGSQGGKEGRCVRGGFATLKIDGGFTIWRIRFISAIEIFRFFEIAEGDGNRFIGRGNAWER